MTATSTSIRTITWADESVKADLQSVRTRHPLTWGITNFIAAPLNANVLLAVEASAAIGGIDGSVFGAVSAADGLWINLAAVTFQTPGTLIGAARAARDTGTPWVFDPVSFGHGSIVHDETARAILEAKPTIIRGNASEIISLAGGSGGARGVDSTAASEDAIELASVLIDRGARAVAISGVVDYIVDASGVTAVPGGDVLLTRVTGAGCSLGALIAAFAAVVDDPGRAAVSASAVYAAAAERAALTARGTGSFAVNLLDELGSL